METIVLDSHDTLEEVLTGIIEDEEEDLDMNDDKEDEIQEPKIENQVEKEKMDVKIDDI